MSSPRRPPERRVAVLGGVVVRLVAAAAAAVACATPPSRADDPPVAEFVARARGGTERYRSQEAAIADGFRRVGIDFPGMGEHWVSLPRIMADSFAAGEPAVLTYVRVDGMPALVGVAYAALLAPGERVPDYAPARGAWHEHNGAVAEESFSVGHEHPARADTARLRLAILHAWVWAENPAGLFATDNPALPLVRLGAPPAPDASPDALRALALALDDDGYFATTLATARSLDAGAAAQAAELIERHRTALRAEAAAVRARRRLTPDQAERLAAAWAALSEELGQLAGTGNRGPGTGQLPGNQAPGAGTGGR